MSEDTLAQALNIAPLPPKQQVAIATEPTPTPPPAVIEEVQEDPEATEDYKLSRTTYRKIITQGSVAIEDMQEIAKDTEAPRSYEVLATLMKTVAEVTANLYDLQAKKKALREFNNGKKLDETNITVDKAVFVGTTADLLKSIKNVTNG